MQKHGKSTAKKPGRKLRYAAVRLYVALLLALFVLTLGIAGVVLFFAYKHAFAPHAPYGALRLRSIWLHIYKVLWRSASQKSYRHMYPQRLTDPPMFSNDTDVMQLRESWTGAPDDCDACTNSCCEQIKCPMFDAAHRCLSYGSLYFGYFYCGRYPSNEQQMQLYNCPKWGLKNETA